MLYEDAAMSRNVLGQGAQIEACNGHRAPCLAVRAGTGAGTGAWIVCLALARGVVDSRRATRGNALTQSS